MLAITIRRNQQTNALSDPIALAGTAVEPTGRMQSDPINRTANLTLSSADPGSRA
jgi:hypothetical protein